MLKKSILTMLFAAAVGGNVMAQDSEFEYKFTVVKENPATSVKNQASTGTCWCFATTSFMESELLRKGKGEFDLSEMFIVRNNYIRRMQDNYYRRGKGNVSQGSIAHMVLWVMDNKGWMPEEVYDGINYDSPTHSHGDLAKWVSTISQTSVDMKKPIPAEIMDGVLDAYLGEVPEKFTYKGKEYTAESFYDYLDLDVDDYVEITSFTHHPFYEQIPVEVPDNWDHQMMYNLPLDEFMAVIDNAINTGYTVAWDGDVSEPGYAFQRHVAVNVKENLGSAQTMLAAKPVEIPVTQESRQKGYENFSTTDDHLEHITGIATDQDGVKYYKTKNSWGTERNGTGYHYLSEEYVKAKTIFVLVHKDSIPKAIKSKLGIK